MDPDVTGRWEVDLNEDDTGVVLSFSEVGMDGVTTFSTAMPGEHAIAFAEAILEKASEL